MARRILTAEDVGAMERGVSLVVDEATTVTAAARDLARRRNITIEEVEASTTAEASPSVRSAAGGRAGAPSGAAASTTAAGDASPGAHAGPVGHLIVTAVGVNRPQVMAELTEAVGRLGGDIQDVSQRITGGYFNAILVVDARRSGHDFKAFRDALLELSEPSDYVVTVIDERVFRTMHRI